MTDENAVLDALSEGEGSIAGTFVYVVFTSVTDEDNDGDGAIDTSVGVAVADSKVCD